MNDVDGARDDVNYVVGAGYDVNEGSNSIRRRERRWQLDRATWTTGFAQGATWTTPQPASSRARRTRRRVDHAQSCAASTRTTPVAPPGTGWEIKGPATPSEPRRHAPRSMPSAWTSAPDMHQARRVCAACAPCAPCAPATPPISPDSRTGGREAGVAHRAQPSSALANCAHRVARTASRTPRRAADRTRCPR